MAFSVFAAGTQTLLDKRGCLEREGRELEWAQRVWFPGQTTF